MENIANFINAHASLVVWSSFALLLITLVFVIFIAIKNTKNIRKFQKSLQSGDPIRYVSEHGTVGKILDINEDEATILLKVQREDLLNPNL
jgi:preprotein translocase subunit YajC